MTADKEFVLQRLSCIGELRTFMPDKVLYPGSQANLNPQNTGKDLPGDVIESRADLVCINEEFGQGSEQLFICKAKIFFPIYDDMVQNPDIHQTGSLLHLAGDLLIRFTWLQVS